MGELLQVCPGGPGSKLRKEVEDKGPAHKRIGRHAPINSHLNMAMRFPNPLGLVYARVSDTPGTSNMRV